MSHHSDELSEIRKILETERDHAENLGATGRYPEGKLTGDDEGEIRVAIAADPMKQKVVINFGKSVAWIGFTPQQAADLGQMLISKALECRGITS